MSTQKTRGQVPDGYWRNAQGNLVPEETIKPIDKERDKLVRKLVASARALQASMAAYKSAAMGDVESFVARSAERYDVKLGGKKGNITLPTYDGQYKIQLAVADRLHFDERIQAAKALVDECIHEWTAGSSAEIKALIEHAFQADKEGQLNTGRVLGLMRLSIEDEKWKRAMEAIKDSMQVASTCSYLRIYERVGDSDRYQQISLDIAGL